MTNRSSISRKYFLADQAITKQLYFLSTPHNTIFFIIIKQRKYVQRQGLYRKRYILENQLDE